MEKKMKAFTNTVENKKQAVAEARKHRKLDMLIQGSYSETRGGKFKGCSVGCTYEPFKGKVEAPNLHALSEPVHGIPQSLTRIRDRVFEGLSVEDARDWHVNFTLSINVGADLSLCTDKLMLWLMTDKNGILKHANEATNKIISKVAQLLRNRIKGIQTDRSECLSILDEARSNRNAAYAAYAAYAAAYAADYAAAYAAYAAYAAAYAAYAAAAADAAAYAAAAADAAAYAAYAADAAADAAAYAADAAAYAAYAAAYAADADADAARRKYFKKIAEKLLSIMKSTKGEK
jgi:hypothetical protein